MLTRLLTAIRPAALVAMAPDAAPHDDSWPPTRGYNLSGADDTAGSPGTREEAVRRFRRLAESCTDGLTALAYAQFADLLELPSPLARRTAGTPPDAAAFPAPRRLAVG